MTEAPRHPAEGLSIEARHAFECIALGQTQGHDRAVLAELKRHDLAIQVGGVWLVHLTDHIAFCEWCATQEPL
ncbi:hypothetical protein [Bosea sp. (in: a-proteobacteria)]|uniref:hypothetical protein n=1 Tax=Bosea sp. (in: a-proteobacteria) TaxID=1871050 RepID=UPI002733B88B|nr:hypothetical protein [Bosea sp. (in: a-proteobacteria)]MDP3408108.1 hypothetical protein [Bosea sp. (in: a-proteobacteria)]